MNGYGFGFFRKGHGEFISQPSKDILISSIYAIERIIKMLHINLGIELIVIDQNTLSEILDHNSKI